MPNTNNGETVLTRLNITAATKDYALQYGAQYSQLDGWHIVGDVPFELEEFVEREPRKQSAANKVSCPKCGSQMHLKENRNGDFFWSCMTFPRCRGTRDYESDATENNLKPAIEYVTETPKKANQSPEFVTRILELALQKLKTEHAIEVWMLTKKVSLGGKRPIDVLHDPASTRKLLDLLEGL